MMALRCKFRSIQCHFRLRDFLASALIAVIASGLNAGLYPKKRPKVAHGHVSQLTHLRDESLIAGQFDISPNGKFVGWLADSEYDFRIYTAGIINVDSKVEEFRFVLTDYDEVRGLSVESSGKGLAIACQKKSTKKAGILFVGQGVPASFVPYASIFSSEFFFSECLDGLVVGDPSSNKWEKISDGLVPKRRPNRVGIADCVFRPIVTGHSGRA